MEFKPLKPPFPYFGGKSKIASIVWEKFGDVGSYVEPFFGTGAVLFGRPDYDPTRHTETVNDLNVYLANFWRAMTIAPDEVAKYADYPVNETDLFTRHQWLIHQEDFKKKMESDPEFFDSKIAGWWVWGACAWIGSGWCDDKKNTVRQAPHLGNDGQGIHRKRPFLSNDGLGIHRKDDGNIYEYFQAIQERTRRVRVCCGDWKRVLTPSASQLNTGKTVGVFLDPPYDFSLRSQCYSTETNCSSEVRGWAITNGDNPQLRICVAGYINEHSFPENWTSYQWTTNGGLGNQAKEGQANKNKFLECLWFSPHCLKPVQKTQFAFDFAL